MACRRRSAGAPSWSCRHQARPTCSRARKYHVGGWIDTSLLLGRTVLVCQALLDGRGRFGGFEPVPSLYSSSAHFRQVATDTESTGPGCGPALPIDPSPARLEPRSKGSTARTAGLNRQVQFRAACGANRGFAAGAGWVGRSYVEAWDPQRVEPWATGRIGTRLAPRERPGGPDVRSFLA